MRPKEPDFLVQGREWLKSWPPKCCHTCEYFDANGLCEVFNTNPPEEFAASVGECDKWEREIPF